METTFITIHDLNPEATILYASDSIVDILGYHPDEVAHRSCWEYFHPAELPLAMARYGKGVEMDKAAVLSYCRMLHKDGTWVGCEIVFTIVHDCMVGCTSIYKRGASSANRAVEAPIVRRLFSSSPRDPRYHMLSHLSSKFTMSAKPSLNEPRAALFLNRYTRTLTIMYATNGLADVLQIPGEDLRGKSFYYCIREDCLGDAIRCLENAKANDSIAYMRFWFRDPRIETAEPFDAGFEHPAAARQSSPEDQDMGGVPLHGDRAQSVVSSTASQHASSADASSPQLQNQHLRAVRSNDTGASPVSGGESSSNPSNPRTTHEAIFGSASAHEESTSSISDSDASSARQRVPGRGRRRRDLELEAVVSCTSDGMVVCLRQARPFPPDFVQRTAYAARQQHSYAVPWSQEPLVPAGDQSTLDQPATTLADRQPPPLATSGDYMASIRECAVFAWALTGINGTIADHGHGTPFGESQPPNGLPVWDPVHAPPVDDPESIAPLQQHVNSLSSTAIAAAIDPSNHDPYGFGDPGLSPRR